MINYTNKGPGLDLAIMAAGHWAVPVGGIWQTSNDVAVQAIIDAYPLSATQNEIAACIDAHAAELRDKVTSGISSGEMASWSIKRTEALAYQSSGNATNAPMLGIEATARGVSLPAIAARVLASAAVLAGFEATIAGVAGKHKDVVRATITFTAALAYDWSGDWPAV